MSVIQLQLRRDTAANWTSANPTLLSGEFGYETNTGAIKIGDGSTVWTSLAYYSTKIRTGSGAPSGALGVVGDLYIDSASGILYLKTAVSTWASQGNLTGPTGPTGPTGASGVVQDIASSDSVAFSIGGSAAHPTIDSPTMAAHTYKGNNTGSAAKPANLTNVQVTADLVAATIALQGMMTANDKKKLNTAIFDVANDFGGDPTGGVDALSAINSAIAAAQTNGFLTGSAGIVWLGGGRFKTSNTVNITGDNVTLGGFGGGSSLDSGNYYTGMGAAIVPTGAFPAVVVSAITTNGLTGQPNTGFKWKGVAVDGYSANATIGLQLISCQNFDIDDFYAINCTDTALDFNTLPGATLTIAAAFPLAAATLTVNSTVASGSGSAFAASGSVIVNDGTGTPRLVTYTGKSGTTLTGASSGGLGSGSAPIGGAVRILPIAQDTTRGVVGQINIRSLDGGATSGIGIRLNGDGGGLANTNLIHFAGNIKIAHLNGIGIKDINSDTNLFNSVVINRAAGGSGIGAEIGAGSTVSLASRNNVFRHASFGAGGLTTRGTPTATFPSGPTRVYDYQLANGEALPTIEAGSILQVNYNGGISPEFNTANSSTGTLTLTGASATLIIGQIKLPPNGLQIGASFRVRYPYTKTAAGTVARISGVKIGPLGTSADPTVNSVTRTPTAIADSGFEEMTITITALGAAANSVMSSVRGKQLATAVGFDTVAGSVSATQGTPVAFSSVTSGFLFLSFFLSSGAASTEVVSVLAPVQPEVLKGGNT